MDKLRIVFGTNDGENIVKHHFGDSKIFQLYELSADGKRLLIDSKENRAKDMEEKKHGDDQKRESVLGQLGQIDIMVAGSLSPNFVKINKTTRTVPCISKINAIEKNLEIIYKEFSTFSELIENKVKNNIIPEIPRIEEE
ncbi:hypothetical protein DRP44_07205 [candidate division TA06 bacterium]|uniref:Uncharacterized protein n=1 Tax=candidate division TA06 bacterium TaxID=2250710 RepID=A0A660S5L0_UNCT6|nr:MAG: hypothetical protein DRP44_07205 [candidate division TA06 bacterium]